MISDKQLAANQANAQNSTGPCTEAGKKRSALNATRHGLTGHVVVLPEEDMDAFRQFQAGIVASFDPANPHEHQLAQSYANFQWRINRAAAIEENLFTLGLIRENAKDVPAEDPEVQNALSYARTFRDESQQINRIAMYSQRLVNQAERVLKQLNQLQYERRERESREMSEAIAAYKAHRIANVPFDARANGFVLSTGQIEAHLRRRNLSDPAFVAQEAARKAA